jgi:thiamine pyrophosphokinase
VSNYAFFIMSRIIIFINGLLTEPEILLHRLRPTDRIFCADGGARHAILLGLTPELIVGDLDSLPVEAVTQMEKIGVIIHRHPVDKDQNDLELALELAVAQKPSEILLVTALGGRLDQMLANIMLLTRPDYASVPIILVDGLQTAQLLHSHASITINGQPGDTLSLIPLTGTVTNVTLKNVEWPLEKTTLSLGDTLTVSNRLITDQATVGIGEGLVLIVHIKQGVEE